MCQNLPKKNTFATLKEKEITSYRVRKCEEPPFFNLFCKVEYGELFKDTSDKNHWGRIRSGIAW
jgi:hypothetical protein